MEEGLTALAGVGCWAKASILVRDLRTHEGQGLLARSHQAWEGGTRTLHWETGKWQGLDWQCPPCPHNPTGSSSGSSKVQGSSCLWLRHPMPSALGTPAAADSQ